MRKVDLPSSTKRESTQSSAWTIHIHWEGPPTSPARTRVVATADGRTKARSGGGFSVAIPRSRPSVYKVPNTFLRMYLNSKPISLVVRSKVLVREDVIYMVPRRLKKLGGDSPCVHTLLAYLKASTYSRTDLRIQIARNSIDWQLSRRYRHMQFQLSSAVL